MSLTISINQIEYTTVSKGAILHLFGRDKDGNAHKIDISGYRPYFYAPIKQADMLPEIGGSHVDLDKIYHTIKGQELRKIYVTQPNDLRDIRSRYQHFEADIPFGTKFMLDHGIKSGIKVNYPACDCGSVEPIDAVYPANLCIADIECEDHRGFPEPERDAIIAVTVWDSFSSKYVTFVISEDLKDYKVSEDHEVKCYITEVAMLTAFSEYIVKRDPDILTGWNFIEFDLPYILKRMVVIGLDPMKMSRLPGKVGEKADKLRGRVIFDLLTAYKRIHVAEGQEVSYRLDAVAESQLGEHKVKYDGNLSDLRVSDPKKLVEYNKVDVELCVKINDKSRIIDFYRQISHYVGCPLDKTLNSSNVVDYYVLRRVNGKYILPSRGNITLDKFQGATVFEPYTGLDENICVFDLKSLYPMSMMTLNASPETKDPNGELHSPDGTRFKKQPDGLTRSIITDLLKERDDKKSQMKKLEMDSPDWEILNLQQNVLKVIMNTYYGVSGYPRFRLFDHDIGAATTSTGRAIIEYSKQIIENEGYKVIYGDSVTGDMKIPIIGSGDIEISNLFTHVDYSNDGKEYCNLKDIYTETITDDGKMVIKPIKYVMRHKCNKDIYNFQLTNQWNVKVTADHSIYQYDFWSDSKLKLVKPSDVNASLIIKRISFDNLVNSKNESKEYYEVLGYFLGDGSLDRKYRKGIYYGYLAAGKDYDEVLNKLIKPLQQCGKINHYWNKGKGDITFNGLEFLKILEKEFYIDDIKTTPLFMFNETTENICAYLRGAFSADGTIIIRKNSPVIRFTQIHKKVCEDLQRLLYKVGIPSSIFKENTKNSYSGKISNTYSYHLVINDIYKFKKYIGFMLDRKQKRLDIDLIDRSNNKDFHHHNVIKKEIIVNYNDYVYDIEVEDTHRFFANNVLVHNTDSSFVHISGTTEQVIKKAQDVEKKLNEAYPKFAKEILGADVSYFTTKFEKLYKRYYQGGKKKRYAGNLIWKEGQVVDKIDIVGFEFKRSDSSKITKEVQETLLKMILMGKTFTDIQSYMYGIIKNYKKLPLDDIAIPGGIGKSLGDYAVDDAQVRGCKYANEHLSARFLRGSKPKRVYISHTTGIYPKTDVICFEYGSQVPKEFVVDYPLMIEKTLKNPISRVIEPLGWHWSDFDPTSRTLSQFGLD